MESAKRGVAPQWVYSLRWGGSGLRSLLGGKGAELAEMTSLGLPVPPGFTVTTEACMAYFAAGGVAPPGLREQVRHEIEALEATTGRGFGDPDNPLLVAVRSGAAVSMPGMMDTILNLGMNREVAQGMARQAGDRRFAMDLYRRFVEMYANVVFGHERFALRQVVEERRIAAGVERVADLPAAETEAVVADLLRIIEDGVGASIPDDPYEQLENAICAVFDSWNTRRAIDYRNHHGIPHDLGTAVNVVAMVFGNMGQGSYTGVLFTRNPATGARELYGEYLSNAQGEDLVAGTSTPMPLARLAAEAPEIHRQLRGVADRLEAHYRDAQDVEFTVEQGRLYILQTRAANRTARAAVKTAVDMVAEGLIDRDAALLRVEPNQIYQLLLPRLDAASSEAARQGGRVLAVGIGASPGGATGAVIFDADEAAALSRQGHAVILARPETSAEDVHGMIASAGIVTSRGGATSHAAVVARGLGKPCVSGAQKLEVDPSRGEMRQGDMVVRKGEFVSVDGATGEVFVGLVDTVRPSVADEHDLAVLLGWADDARRLGVWANADKPKDVKIAMDFGAEGIGLCRTEHMFFEPKHLAVVREMILSGHVSLRDPANASARSQYLNALAQLQEMQVQDFTAILKEAVGRPVIIRLLDPPLHEFLPRYEELLLEVAEMRNKGNGGPALAEKQTLLELVNDLREANPMLGLRGCRLGLMYPEIYDMQARAIVHAAAVSDGASAAVKIMVPLVSDGNEMDRVRWQLEEAVRLANEERGSRVHCAIGAMIEVPRAALVADEIARSAEFFSFGTNDLTQATFAFSRDDAEGTFLSKYLRDDVLHDDPFQVLDRRGVGKLVSMAFELGRAARPGLSVGVCGEHGGEPNSIQFFHDAGLDYVSCSPYRVPIARLAAAQAALRHLAAAADASGLRGATTAGLS